MSKAIYLQCPTGISGDMCLGALVSLGVPLEYLVEKLDLLGIAGEYKLRTKLVKRCTQEAIKVCVDLITDAGHQHQHHHSRHLPEIENMIFKAHLPPKVEVWSLKIFQQLAVAEGSVHGIPKESVHFHEVGATDAIIDIVGTCLGLDWLGIDCDRNGLPMLYCSPQPVGGGTVKAAHGKISVPVPAVLKLWEMGKCPVYSNGIEKELVTPTGAAIATALAVNFGSPPAMRIEKIGNGAGSLDLPIPNILRLWLGEIAEDKSFARSQTHHEDEIHHHQVYEALHTNDSQLTHNHHHTHVVQKQVLQDQTETVCVLETQIDDLSPQVIAYVFERLFAVGALDVFTQAIGMKKSRLGVLLTVICPPDKSLECETILFEETTTLGIRRFIQERSLLQRENQKVNTAYGVINMKIAWQTDGENKVIRNVHPEYEDCARLARSKNIPLQEVQREALESWYQNK
ncbi:MAG: nickel pincer cofactor biosynthesis protein LarC [Mastigocoleus sp.]